MRHSLSFLVMLCFGALLLIACESDDAPVQPTPEPTAVPWRVSSDPIGIENVQQMQLIGRINIHQSTVSRMRFSDDGRYLATMSNGDRRAHVWDLEAGSAIVSVTGYDPIWTFFSPDNQFFYVIDRNRQITQWSMATGERITEFEAHTSNVGPIAFSGDGNLVAVGGGQGAVYLITLDPFERGRRIDAHPVVTVSHVVLSDDGQLLITQGVGGGIKVWNTETGDLLHEWTNFPTIAEQIAFSPITRQLAFAFDDHIELYDLDTYQREGAFSIRQEAASAYLEYINDGNTLLMYGYDQYVELWDLETQELMVQLQNGAPVLTAQMSEDARLVLTATRSNIFVWNLTTISTQIQRGAILVPAGNRLNDLVWSSDNRLIVFANELGGVFFFGIPDANQPTPQVPDIDENNPQNDEDTNN